MRKSAYLEIGALLESQWTGIGAVVAALTKCALADSATEWRFLYQSFELPRPLVERMINERSGASIHMLLSTIIWEQKLVTHEEAAACKCVFTNIKPLRGFFKEEAMMIYDLSPLLTPQFHNTDNINHFGYRFRGDVETSTQFFPISEATRNDLEAYFDVPRHASTIVPLGMDIDPTDLSLAQQIARSYDIEPYVVVLGTLEPRKNGQLVLDYIARNPSFAHRYRVVFVGRDGWLNERERLIAKAESAGVARERIIFTGFVSDREKIGLLYNAAFCIYASFFEGYGLPILEAAVLGKVVVCSRTSSMLEVAPASCLFFDPTNVFDFARAISIAERRSSQIRPVLALPEMQKRLRQHGWAPCYAAIREWVQS